MKPGYYTAIIFLEDGSPKKYRDIHKIKMKVFELWAVAKFPTAKVVNYYDHERKFVKQKKLSE